jgi:D-alanyl-D-alanine carboxypeptidase
MLAYLLERVYGKSYAEILESGILAPLGLEDTGFGLFPESDERFARNWMEYALVREVAPWRGACITSGSMDSTTADLAVFFTALVEGRIVSKASFALMHARTIAEGAEAVGYGFWAKADGSFYKTGSICGYRALVYRHPGRDTNVYILSSKWTPPNGGSIADSIVPVLLAELEEAPGPGR